MTYPLSLFTQAILPYLPAATLQLIDSPCGAGETSFDFAKKCPNIHIVAADIDTQKINTANKKYAKTRNLEFHATDIHSFVDQQDKFEAFCLINSLFLLPRPVELIQKISKKLKPDGRLFLILPNPDSENFKRYQKIEPEVNSFILFQKEYEEFCHQVGLKILAQKGLCRVPFFGRTDTKILFPVRDKYLEWLESRSKSKDYAYFLLVLEKKI